jgi:broad specificity phosphatase PhoE
MQNQALFYIVRHGETEWNVQNRLQGHGDSPLTSRGEEQVRDFARELTDINFDLVFSSDLLRAQRTAEIIAVEKKLAVTTTQLLRERSFGKYEGKTRQEFENENKELIERHKSLTGAERGTFKYADDMESDEEVVTRLLIFLRETAVAYPGKNIWVVSHGGVLRILLQHLGYAVQRGSVSNAAHIELASDGVEFAVQAMKGIRLDDTRSV